MYVYVCALVNGFRYMYVSMTISRALNLYRILTEVKPILRTLMILNSWYYYCIDIMVLSFVTVTVLILLCTHCMYIVVIAICNASCSRDVRSNFIPSLRLRFKSQPCQQDKYLYRFLRSLSKALPTSGF